jgi:hypothetical protein
MSKSLPTGRQMSNECQIPWFDKLTMISLVYNHFRNTILSLSKG